MKYLTLALVALCTLIAAGANGAQRIALSETNSGFYWYQRSAWLGGSDTQTGFSYGDAGTGLVHAQNLYYYYGGADRYWERKDAFFQIDLSSLSGEEIRSATFNIYVTANSAAETFLKHLDIQSTVPTGDASQKLAGTADVLSSTALELGWNQVDVLGSIQSDIANGYAHAVFSIPQFSQVQDQNRLLSFYGASSTVMVDGVSVVPYLEVVTSVPEPAALGGIASGFLLLLVLAGRCRRKL